MIRGSDVYRVKVFTEDSKSGNLAGVVLDTASLSDIEMQEIARQVNASETAFVFSSTNADYKVRWFTPNTEVGFCVHATLATLATLEHKNLLYKPEVLIETSHTILQAKKVNGKWFVRVEDFVLLEDQIDRNFLCDSLKVKQSSLSGVPRIVQIFSDKELIVPVQHLALLQELEPEISHYANICNQLKVTGISIFTSETFDPALSYHTREFAPLYGYLEDPLCGMAAGAIAAYLRTQGNQQPLRIEQGVFLNSPGIIEVIPENTHFWIGGSCTILRAT
ncbi:MAG: PhzF family phenazine biosynthesis protein [Chlamydiales bacterium]|nr:PhzF family phenazine biosynthesis protein [Chlamydiales bacterium]